MEVLWSTQSLGLLIWSQLIVSVGFVDDVKIGIDVAKCIVQFGGETFKDLGNDKSALAYGDGWLLGVHCLGLFHDNSFDFKCILPW